MSHAQEEPPPRFQFAQLEALELSWTALQERGVEVEIVNNSTKRLDGLRVKLSDLGLKAPEEGSQETSAVKNAKALAYATSVSLSPAGSSKITLRAVDSPPDLAPADYVGSITVSDADTDTVVRRTVQLAVENPQAKTVPEPMVEDWTVRAYRLFPLVDALPWIQTSYNLFVDQPIRLSGQSLPLDAKPEEKSKLDPMAGKRLGFAEGGPGSAAVVVSTGKLVTMSDNVVGLKLAFDGLGRPGKYEGKLDFDPDDDETVALTVEAKDIVLWPMLVILGGLMAGLRAKRYIGKGRKVLVLQEREAQAGTDFDDAQKRFSEKAVGKPYATYSIEDKLADCRKELQEKLKRLASAQLVTLNETDPDYTSVVKDLERVETAVKAWASFGDKLVTLDSALGLVEAKAENAPRPRISPTERAVTRPAFLTNARKLLTGQPMTLDLFESKLQEVDKATTLARSWGESSDRVEELLKLIANLERHPDAMEEDEKRQLRRAKRTVSEAHSELWRAEDADQLQSKAAIQDLDEAESILWGLRYVLPENLAVEGERAMAAERRPAPHRFGDVLLLNKAFVSDDEVVTRAGPPDDAARARLYADAREKADGRLWWLALALALVTGLASLYIGKPFGTFWDYVNAAAWGASTVLAVSALSAALEGLPGVRELFGSLRSPR